MKIRYRRKRSAQINPRDKDADEGDLYVTDGRLTRCETPSGWGMRTRGWLYSRRIKPPKEGMIAIVEDNEIYWINPSTEESDA